MHSSCLACHLYILVASSHALRCVPRSRPYSCTPWHGPDTTEMLLQVSVKLYQFDQLGPEFIELATQYRDLQEDLEHANFTLQEFQKVAAN